MKTMVFLFIIIDIEISWTNAEVTWPSGAYGLPKAKTGCPKSEGRTWKEGWIYQDLEDDEPLMSQISKNSHLEAKFMNNNINRTFCMKTNIGISKREWPKGFYCVYKSNVSSCPNGMKEGSVFWDDEDDKNNNNKRDTLPDGTYDSDTMIKYCCQDEGHWYNAVQLPVDRPFFLLPHNSPSFKYPKCQLVKWANSFLEYIKYDTEDYRSGDYSNGSHVFIQLKGDSFPKIYYCFYKGCCNHVTGNNGSITSSNTGIFDSYPQSQYCSWLVAVSKNLVVLLNFTYFNVSHCGRSFVKIFDGVNDRAPLLTTYCGSNATSGSTIVSSANNVYVVLKYGTYLEDTEIRVRFQANYISQPKEILSSAAVLTNSMAPVTYIIIAVVAGITLILVAVIIVIYTRRRRRKMNRLKTEQLRNRKKEENVYNDGEALTESNNLMKRVVDINPSTDQSGYAVPAEIIPGVIPRSFNTPGSYKVPHAVASNEDDDGYTVPGEAKSEVIPIPIPDFFNTPADCEVSHAVADNEDVDGYLLPVEKTLGATPGCRRQHYQSLDVLRRKDEENEYQPLVGVERFSKAGPSDDVDKPDGTYMELNCNRENRDALYTSLQSKGN